MKRRRPNKNQEPAQRRVEAMIAELDNGSADDALRKANWLAQEAAMARSEGVCWSCGKTYRGPRTRHACAWLVKL